MVEHIVKYTLPATYSLLPPAMNTPAASALLVSIGLQETNFEARRQVVDFSPFRYGPARSFWQFERNGGLLEVCTHRHTRAELDAVLCALSYREGAIKDLDEMMTIITHNDIVATAAARLLLWIVPARLPQRNEAAAAWLQYLKGWKPGKPHEQTWSGYFKRAWEMVEPTE